MPKSKSPPGETHRPAGKSTVKPKGKFEPARTNASNCDKASVVDERLQLVNCGERGLVHDVSIPLQAITSVRGILLDFDPDRLHPDLAAAEILADPRLMWKLLIRNWLSRHPVFAKAQVVASGRGLHAILRFSEPIQFETEGDRSKWAAVVKIVQNLLPSDPDCPGLTALTRPVGSINGKNGAAVELLFEGEPVGPDEVLALCGEASAKPFSTVVNLLYGQLRISPCPVCQGEGSRLDALDHRGLCYGGCGKLQLGQIWNLFLMPRPVKKGSRKA